MAGTETITLRLVAQDLMSGNVSKAIGGLDKLAKQGGLAGSVMQGVGQSFGQMLNPMALASKAMDLGATAAAALFDGMQDLARAYEGDKLAAQQFANTLARSLPDWQNHTAAMDAAILAGQRMGYGDDQQRMSLSKLVTATRSATRAVDLNRLAMNIARQRSISLEAATAAVTKAAQGQTRGLKGLGYQIDATADVTEQLDSVMRQAAGAADLYANSAGGKLAARMLALNERGEALGENFTRLAGTTNDLAMVVPELGLVFVENAGVIADFLGLGEQAVEDLKTASYDLPQVAMRYVEFSQTVIGATETFRRTLHGMPDAVATAVVDMKSAVRTGKKGIIAEFRDLAWQTKHPFAEKNYENWLKERQHKAQRKMEAAAKAGKPGVVAQYRQLVFDIQTELNGLPGYAQRIHDAVMRSMAGAGGIGSGINTPKWPDKGNGRGGGSAHEPPTGKRAMGGPVAAGQTYLVGEQGPEVLRMGSGSGNITPNHALGGSIHVHFHGVVSAPSEAEGARLAQVIAPHLQRHMARGGR